jgi:hypothetical protein
MVPVAAPLRDVKKFVDTFELVQTVPAIRDGCQQVAKRRGGSAG